MVTHTLSSITANKCLNLIAFHHRLHSSGAVRASSLFPILSVGLLFLGGVCVAASEFYKSRYNVILSAGILFVSAGQKQIHTDFYSMYIYPSTCSPSVHIRSHCSDHGVLVVILNLFFKSILWFCTSLLVWNAWIWCSETCLCSCSKMHEVNLCWGNVLVFLHQIGQTVCEQPKNADTCNSDVNFSLAFDCSVLWSLFQL